MILKRIEIITSFYMYRQVCYDKIVLIQLVRKTYGKTRENNSETKFHPLLETTSTELPALSLFQKIKCFEIVRFKI